MVALLRSRPDFRRLWLGDIVSYLGDWLTYVAVSLFALADSDGLLPVALVLVAHALPHAVFSPLGGTLTDRLDRRTVMVGTNLLRVFLTLAMAGAALAGSLVGLQVLLMVRVSVGAFFVPAQTAALPKVVERHEIKLANALTSATWSIMFTVGVGLGGVLAALVGPTLAIALDAVTFLVATVILWGLPPMPPEGGERKADLMTLARALTQDMSEAWQHARSDLPLLEAVLAKTPLLAATGGAWVTLNQLAEDLPWAGSAAMTLGLLQASRGIGTGIGPLVETRLAARTSDDTSWTLTALVTFVSIGALAMVTDPVALMIVAFLWGAGIGANWVAATSRMQQIAPDRLMGRLSSIDFLALTAAESAIAVAGALIGDWVGDAAASAWTGLAAGLIFWAVIQGAVRAGRRLSG